MVGIGYLESYLWLRFERRKWQKKICLLRFFWYFSFISLRHSSTLFYLPHFFVSTIINQIIWKFPEHFSTSSCCRLSDTPQNTWLNQNLCSSHHLSWDSQFSMGSKLLSFRIFSCHSLHAAQFDGLIEVSARENYSEGDTAGNRIQHRLPYHYVT